MKSAELMTLLKKHGWMLVRIRGSHYQFRHPDFAGVITVPYSRHDIKQGTLHHILTQALLK